MATFYAGQTDYIDILNTLATANAVANVGASLSTIDASIAAAATSATNAAISYDAFDDRYLGSKASNPVADNDGQTLLVGAMHWNTTGSEMRVYTGTTWVAVQTTTASTAAATSATNSASSATNAATSATNAGTSATNAAGSATTASTQATNAATSATNAAGSATSAASSATTATTKANEAVTSATNAGTSATNAAGSATTASTQATNAATSSTLSQNWATQLATPVSGGEYSAKYWAQQAAAAITGQLVYRGSWSAATATYPSTPAKGDYYKVSVAGTVSSVDYAVNDSIIYNGTGWDKIDSTDSVTSVAGKVGVVTLVKADVGLANVDNTSDANKPVSTAQTAAFAPIAHVGSSGTAHANVVAAGAAGFMTGADKTKLDAVTGTNTGDQINISGSAASSSALTLDNTDRGFGNHAQFMQGSSSVNYPTTDWWSSIRLLHNNASGYYTEIAGCFHTDDLAFRRNVGNVKSPWKIAAWKDGSNSSGTWTINVTGNAGTATALSVGADRTKLDAITGTNTGDQTNISGNASTATTAASLLGFTNSNAGNPVANADALTNNGTAYVSSISLFNVSDGALHAQAFSEAWVHQIYGDYRTGQIAVRGKNSGAWQAWRTVLDASNFNNYAPTLTGIGASGTWGININGTVGATTPAAGSFTSLSASGVTTFGTAAPTGMVQTIQSSAGDKLRIYSGADATGMALESVNAAASAYSKLIVNSTNFAVGATGLSVTGGISATGALTTAGLKEDASGNLGLGVVPSASTLPIIDSQYGMYNGRLETNILNNVYYSTSQYKYQSDGYASLFYQNRVGGGFQWLTAPSGLANANAAFTSVMTLDVSGNLNIANLTASKAVFTDASKNLTTTGTLGVAQGGTGATTASAALTALGAYAATNPSGYTTNVGDVTLAGTQTLTNKTITETVFVVTGTTPALTATNGAVQTWTLTAASTPTDALTTGQSIILVITPGANAITWPGVTWTKQGGSGTLPSLFSAGKTMVVLWKVGTTLYGSHLGDTA